MFGQVRVVDCSGYGDRADEDTEGEHRFAFFDLAGGVVDEVGQHGQAFLHLTGAVSRAKPPARAPSVATPATPQPDSG
jgi:hypothetical protein